MSLKICTFENMLSDHRGIGMRKNYFPRVVTEAFLESTRDGEISRAPDPVTMIDGDLTWNNNTPDVQVLAIQIHRGPRTVVAQSPGTVVIHDAFSHQVAISPQADFPSIMQDSTGGRLQIDRASVAREDVLFGRFFFDTDDSTCWAPIGEIKPGFSVHFRYLAAVQTPGVWTIPSEFEPRWEAHARWTRLRAWAFPLGSL
ncbi:DUF7172 family protein [Mycobacteroides abscessus]|uniref:DUF7172 family protein n=1 Tax=Mycobacteroides abscessus TaxID=36809 RepID=UPI000C264C60|nr:hypothetical protein [Mycobacteroides abscessus]